MHNFILISTVFFTTIASEFAFNTAQGTTSSVPLEKYFALLIILAVFSTIRSNFWRRLSMNFTLGLSFFQMCHILYYSVPIYPNALYLFFAEISEISATLSQELDVLILPFVIVAPLLAFNIYIDKKAQDLKTFRWVHWIFILYFIYNPMRTYATGNTWGRQPSTQEFMGMNVYLSFSYFAGRLLPAKIMGINNQKFSKPEVKFTKTQPRDFNIILVLGESLTPNHMSLFGYERETTPYLKSLKDDENFSYFRGIASGVSTDVALALFMNNTYGVRGSEDVIKGERCLFKLAKESGFTTHFYSTQSKQQLRYVINSICPSFIDDYKDLYILDPEIDDPDTASDLTSIDYLPSQMQGNHFYVLHQRGTHGPYNLRYPQYEAKFEITGDFQKDRVNHYDNGVVQFDKYMEKLINKIKVYDRSTLIVYLSDHGEGLGEENVWGHAVLRRPSFEIPILFYQHKIDDIQELKRLPENPTQFTLSLLISSFLGHKPERNIFITPVDYTILANDIDGFAGFLNTVFNNGELIEIERADI